MTEKELKLLMDCARLAKQDPSALKEANPFEMKGNVAISMQAAAEMLDPVQAARWRAEAGATPSLQAAAVKAGLMEMSEQVHKELMSIDADYAAGVEESKARREAEILDSMEKGAAELAAKREAQSQAHQRASGNSNTGQHSRDFLRRMGVSNAAQLSSIPARRMLGK